MWIAIQIIMFPFRTNSEEKKKEQFLMVHGPAQVTLRAFGIFFSLEFTLPSLCYSGSWDGVAHFRSTSVSGEMFICCQLDDFIINKQNT